MGWNRLWNNSERGNSVSVVICPTTGALWSGPRDGLPAVRVLQSETASCTREIQLPLKAKVATQAQLLLPTHSSHQNICGDHAECSNMRSCPACLTMVWQSHTQDFKQKTFIKAVRRKSNKKPPPETVIYFPICFLFLTISVCWGLHFNLKDCVTAPGYTGKKREFRQMTCYRGKTEFALLTFPSPMSMFTDIL